MKANELMLGDLLKPKNVDSYFKVGLIGANSIWNDTDTAEWDLDEIEPIPLTPKILEKNGFTRPNVRVQYFTESTDYYDVDIHEITDSIWCFEYQNCEAHFPPCLILIAHVHELQHALRLCGIEKEIEL